MSQEEQIRVVKTVRSNCLAAIRLYQLRPVVVAEMVGMTTSEVRQIWRIDHWYPFYNSPFYTDPFLFAKRLGLSAEQAIDGNFRKSDVKTRRLAQKAKRQLEVRTAAKLEIPEDGPL